MKLSQITLNRIAELPAYLLPPGAARWVARGLYRLFYQALGRSSLKATASAIQLTLAEPRSEANALARACFAAKGAQRSNYRSMARRAHWQEAANDFGPAVFRLLADESQPLVILTLHQADYLAGLLAALKLTPVSREIHIIKLAEWTLIEERAYEHFRQYGHTLVIHRLSEKPAKKIVRALRRHAILVTFVDVPREFGTTAPVWMFGLPFQLTSGPLAMARLAGARILPVFSSYSAQGSSNINAGKIIETRPSEPAGERTKPSIECLAQQLAGQIESNLRRCPAQWEMWPVISNLLDQQSLQDTETKLTPSALVRIALVNQQTQKPGLPQNI